MIEITDISQIVEQGLCNGCGTCFSVCPNNAISIEVDQFLGILYAALNEKKCVKCKKCLSVCPSVDILEWDQKNTKNILGNYSNLYYGYSLNKKTRYHASSGGIVSSLITYLFINKMIDGFILVRPSKNSPFLNEPFVSTDINDIAKYAGTRYSPIPVNKIIKEIQKCDGKFALVGTPCVIRGFSKYAEILPKIKEKIFIKIGFFCLGAPNLNAYEYYTRYNNIDVKDLISIRRGDGWPGNNVFSYHDGKKIIISRRPKKLINILHHTVSFYPIFAQKRCILCVDRFSNSSDVSVGDAWLDEFKNDKIGTSLIIVRNAVMDDIIKLMNKDDSIYLNTISKEKILSAQNTLCSFIDNYPTTYNYFYRSNIDHNKNIKINYFWSIHIRLICMGMKLSRHKALWRVLWLYGLLFIIFRIAAQKLRRF